MEMSLTDHNHLLALINKKLEQSQERDSLLSDICWLLKDNVKYYDWVGFYLVDPEKKDELILGPFAGEATEHVRIPFGRGICGQAASRGETFLIQDVSQQTNYLSCSTMVKSEIVVPIFKNNAIVGELDIDSHQLSPFTEQDRTLLENICQVLGNQIF